MIGCILFANEKAQNSEANFAGEFGMELHTDHVVPGDSGNKVKVSIREPGQDSVFVLGPTD